MGRSTLVHCGLGLGLRDIFLLAHCSSSVNANTCTVFLSQYTMSGYVRRFVGNVRGF